MTAEDELQQLLYDEIPLTREIGIRAVTCSPERVILSAPLQPNLNHKCTAFGGSLYSVAVLCGWSLVHCLMKQHSLEGHIVIQHSDVDYRAPVDGEIVASCEIKDKSLLDRFIQRYQRKGLARIKLDVTIQFNDIDAVIFHGHYVVHH